METKVEDIFVIQAENASSEDEDNSMNDGETCVDWGCAVEIGIQGLPTRSIIWDKGRGRIKKDSYVSICVVTPWIVLPFAKSE